ncbi:GPW/gp25 family protein [Phenylobacterium sp.]|uniref:GPW/gp25 family protein n=1 Tax=Phenylobacterium sp. TaxID=1871053 RepID=UPI003BA9651F
MPAFAAFPYRIASNGLTAEAGPAEHIAQLIAQVLFVDPGERVNRPQFGAGLRQLVFQSGPEAAALVEAMAQSALRQWLVDVVHLEDVSVAIEGPTTAVLVTYVDVRTRERRQVRLEG